MRRALPNGLAVITDLYRDHILFAAMIAASLFAGGFLIPQLAGF